MGLNASAESYNVNGTTLQLRLKGLRHQSEKDEVVRNMLDSGNDSEDDSNRTKYGSKYKICQVFSVEERKNYRLI